MRNLTDKNIAILAIVVIVVTTGASPVFTKIALRELSPEFYSFLRFLVASLILLPLFLKNGIKLNKDLLVLISISLVLTTNILAFAYGVRLTTATISNLLYVLGPIVIAIFSYFLLKERITNAKIVGILMGIIGAGIVIILPVIQRGTPFAGDIRGNMFILLGVLCTSFYATITKKMHVKYSPIQITTVFSLTTCFVMLVLSFHEILNNAQNLLSISQQALFIVFYVGVVCTAMLYLLYQYAIKHSSPLVASTVLFLTPFSTIVWAGIILGERLTWLLAIGAMLALLGTYFIVRSSKPSEIDIEP